jgi:hypothetical protein
MMRIWTMALTMAFGAVAWAQAPAAPGAPYEHAGSGVSFPAAPGAFQRTRVSPDSDGSISVDYLHETGTERVTATVSADHSSAEDGICRKTASDDRFTASRRAGVIFDQTPVAPPGWETAGFAVNGTGSMGSQEHFYYCRDGWVIQFNFRHSPDLDAGPLEADFLDGFPLPEKR